MAATYEAKNVLITGAAGFIASHVAILFAKKYPHYKVGVGRPNLFLFPFA
jgi:UDP-glucose 4,6-dehydratase